MYIEFRPGEKFASKDADMSNTLDNFKDAGYIIKDFDLIIDIDCLDKEVIKKMITIFDINTETVWTERGCHLYFKKPTGFGRGANRVCALGFPIEFKHNKNTKAITVKREGVVREVERQGLREDLPLIFSLNKHFENLIGRERGEGMNNALFSHRQKLANCSGWREMLRFINNNIFGEPLPEDQFQSITRDMVVIAEKDNEPEIAEYLLNKYKIVMFNKKIYFNINGVYKTDNEELIRIIFDKVGSKKTRYVDEVLKQIQYRCTIMNDEHTFDIKFKNGILRNGEFIEVDYDDFTPYVIDIAYDPEAKPVQIVDDYIEHLTQGDENYKKIIFEVIAHTLIVDKDFKRLLAKFFIFVGGGGNGKGTLLQIIKKILGQGNCTGLSISNMSDDRYITSMKGKLANLGDDIQDQPIDNEMMKNLKNISTCDFIQTRELYKESEGTSISSSLIFTSNHVVKSFEKGDAYKRRVMWLPMFTVVKEESKDINFINKITAPDALEYWIKQIMEAYFRLYKEGKFTTSEVIEKYNAEYHKENNTALIFLDDYELEDILDCRPPEIYEQYEIWCDENGYNTASKRMIKDAIKYKFNLDTVVKKMNGKTQRVYDNIPNLKVVGK